MASSGLKEKKGEGSCGGNWKNDDEGHILQG